jgi:hypothetical protein
MSNSFKIKLLTFGAHSATLVLEGPGLQRRAIQKQKELSRP